MAIKKLQNDMDIYTIDFSDEVKESRMTRFMNSMGDTFLSVIDVMTEFAG